MPRLTAAQKARFTDYATTFGTESGQRVLEDLYRAYGRRTSYTKGDSHDTAFNEGKRYVYLQIRAAMRLADLPEEDPIEEDAEL